MIRGVVISAACVVMMLTVACDPTTDGATPERPLQSGVQPTGDPGLWSDRQEAVSSCQARDESR